ncbi:lupus La protein-like [Mercenaria mercenaria]|uniref:lupus La protein-like n=1 Tax=Mercenaria mercenaria TaxID=6596 RepID=UPI00234E8A66|nr:lupus La protein-like [Mercenaria mercenaria]
MSTETSTDVEKKVIRQVEYYFGDCNLPRDRFLQEQVKQDDGWVPLEIMLNFNRLKQITEDTAVIAESLRKSTSGLIEVSEDGKKIRRNPDQPIPENNEQRKQELAARSIYAKMFPLDSTLDTLQAWFETFGEVESLSMRKDVKKKFKGSVFVTFKAEDSVKKFLEAESVKFNDVELEKRLSKNAYYQQKQEERKQFQEEKQKKKDKATNRQKDDGWQKIENEMPKGALLLMTGMNQEETRREDIKNVLQDYGPIAWIDFNRGDPECVVRYDKENMAKEVLEKVMEANNNEIIIHENKLEARVLEGEEEVARWRKMHEDSINRKLEKQNRYSKNRQKGRWGKRPSKATRDALKKAKAEERGETAEKNDNDEPPAKKVRVEVTVEGDSNGD